MLRTTRTFRPRIGIACAATLAIVLCHGSAVAEVKIRVSIKRVFDASGNAPGTGLVCNGIGAGADTREKIERHMDYANEVLALHGRGLSFDYEIVDLLTTPTPPTDLSGVAECASLCSNVNWSVDHWSQMPGGGCQGCVLDWAARNDPVGLGYRADAFNIYVTDLCGGGSANPRSSNGSPLRVVTIGNNVRGMSARWIHELGHALNLCHTHGGGACNGRCSSPNPTGCSSLGQLGDDCSSDTYADANQCVTLDDLTQVHESMDYTQLDLPDRDPFLDTWFNVMSYHRDDDAAFWSGLDEDFDCRTEGFAVLPECTLVGQDVVCPGQPSRRVCRYRLTPDQLDFATDRVNSLYVLAAAGLLNLAPGIASGRSFFVDATGDDLDNGSAFSPLRTLSEAIGRVGATATEEDVILLRGGSTYDTSTLTGATTGPVTLRATRGDANIR